MAVGWYTVVKDLCLCTCDVVALPIWNLFLFSLVTAVCKWGVVMMVMTMMVVMMVAMVFMMMMMVMIMTITALMLPSRLCFSLSSTANEVRQGDPSSGCTLWGKQ